VRGEKGKKGVDVKAGRVGICSQISCAGGREGVVGLVLTRGDERKENVEVRHLCGRQAGDPTRTCVDSMTLTVGLMLWL
jgi:hypothetical protein